jgi:NADPH:quinone reductase
MPQRIILRHADLHSGLQLESFEPDAPAPGQVLVEQHAIGINFLDLLQAEGRAPLSLPSGLGFESAGRVAAVGAGVSGWREGDRVGVATAGVGAYATHRAVPAEKLVRLPAHVSDEAAAALLFKGLTAQYLVRKTHRVQPGDVVVVHAAAGGVGQILLPWCRALGARTLAVTGSPEKEAGLHAAGATATAVLGRDSLREVLLAQFGSLARVVYDSVGAASWEASLDALAPFGLFVVYGAASGPCPAIEPELLNRKGCLFMTRPSVFPHNATAELLQANAADLFEALQAGQIAVPLVTRYPLHEAARALADLRAKRTVGALVLDPLEAK